jgi:pimeloyl-ACP methyl ester carboxylesterase
VANSGVRGPRLDASDSVWHLRLPARPRPCGLGLAGECPVSYEIRNDGVSYRRYLAVGETSGSRVIFDGRGVKLVADAYGDEGADPVLLLHGGGQTRHAWGHTAIVLAERGFRSYTVDLRGHGESDWSPNGEYGPADFAGDIQDIALSLPRLPALVGASLGGVSALTAIADAPRPIATALVLVDVAPRIEPGGVRRIAEFMTAKPEGFESLEEVADAIAVYNPHRPRPKSLEGLKKNVRLREDGRWVWHWDPAFMSSRMSPALRDMPDETRALHSENHLEVAARSLTIPTLVVRGRMSDLLSEEGALHMLTLVPHAKLVDVAGAGHMVAGDRNDLFNDAVVDFLVEAVGR